MRSMIRSAAGFEIPDKGAGWRIVKFVRQYAVTGRDTVLQRQIHGRLRR